MVAANPDMKKKNMLSFYAYHLPQDKVLSNGRKCVLISACGYFIMPSFYWTMMLMNTIFKWYNINLHQDDKKILLNTITQNNIMIVLISRGPDLFSTKSLSLDVIK